METVELLDTILQKLEIVEQKLEEQDKQFKNFQNIFQCSILQKEMSDLQSEEIVMKCMALLLKATVMSPISRMNKKLTEECKEAAKVAISDSFSCTEVIEEMIPRVKELFDKTDGDTDLDQQRLYAKTSGKSQDNKSVKESS